MTAWRQTLMVMLGVSAIVCALRTGEAERRAKQTDDAQHVHVVCVADDTVVWEGDAARADYADGQWTICPTSRVCASTAAVVWTSAACVVTPLPEATP